VCQRHEKHPDLLSCRKTYPFDAVSEMAAKTTGILCSKAYRETSCVLEGVREFPNGVLKVH
jgi:hypothetical protein